MNPSEPTTDFEIFDRRLVRRHRDRAAAGFSDHAFLKRDVGRRLIERLMEIHRRFTYGLDLGSHTGALAEALKSTGVCPEVVALDLSPAMLAAAGGPRVAASEDLLPFAPNAFDLVVSSLALHWVNDLPGALIQICQVLKPDGLFLAAMFGGETLKELRTAWLEADIETTGGATPRISPFVDVRDAGNLLQRAGFALPVADVETLTVTYPNVVALMRDLRGMGEANALYARHRGTLGKRTLAALQASYRRLAGGPDGRLPVTFQIVWMTGWAPHPSQPKPLRPGSARARLADALGTIERPLKD